MMRNYSNLIMLLLLLGCGTSLQDAKLLKEAAEVHNAALQIAKDVETRIKQDGIHADSVLVIGKAIEEWEHDLVEVPGNEHHHHHHEGHHHSHEPVNITATEMLQLQQELKQRIELIKKRADLLTQ